MGFACGWIAVRSKETDEVLDGVGLTHTGEFDEELPESQWSGVSPADGWYVVFFDHPAPREFEDSKLQVLSEGCEVLASDDRAAPLCARVELGDRVGQGLGVEVAAAR